MVEFKEKLPVGRKVDVDTMVTGTDDLIEEIMCTDSTKYYIALVNGRFYLTLACSDPMKHITIFLCWKVVQDI